MMDQATRRPRTRPTAPAVMPVHVAVRRIAMWRTPLSKRFAEICRPEITHRPLSLTTWAVHRLFEVERRAVREHEILVHRTEGQAVAVPVEDRRLIDLERGGDLLDKVVGPIDHLLVIVADALVAAADLGVLPGHGGVRMDVLEQGIEVLLVEGIEEFLPERPQLLVGRVLRGRLPGLLSHRERGAPPCEQDQHHPALHVDSPRKGASRCR